MDESFSSLMARAVIMFNDGQFGDALNQLHKAVELARKLPPPSKELAQALEFRSKVHRKRDSLLEAERDLHESVTIYLKRIRRKGRSLSGQHKYREAENLYREALEVCRKTFGPRHRETATCLDNLGSNLKFQSRFQESLLHCQNALEVRQELLGDEHAHTATSFCNVGYLYRLLGRHDDALPLLVKSLQIRERLLGGDHVAVAESLDRIASVYRDQGRFAEALPHCDRALQIREDTLGLEHPLTGASKNNKALILERRKEDRSGDSSAGVDAGAGAFAENDAVTPAAPQGRESHESHAAGYAILAVVGLGATTTGVLFWFLPLLGVVVGLAVIAFTAGSFLTSVSFESLVLRALGRARAAKAKAAQPDRDSMVLGRANGRGVEVKPASRSSVLTADGARELPDYAASDVLDLHWVKSMTPAAADELATRLCGLCINGLEDLPSKLAKALRKHQGSLELDGITEITVPAAAAIRFHEGPSLKLGLLEVSVQVAEHLAHHRRGSLLLPRLRTIDEDCASWIIKHRGAVELKGLQLVTRHTVRILRSAPHIILPDDLGEGI
jgi:tetratricopeptide (TPR) repeat protein